MTEDSSPLFSAQHENQRVAEKVGKRSWLGFRVVARNAPKRLCAKVKTAVAVSMNQSDTKQWILCDE
jgi:tRNA A37 threonylcarbamoyladenosine synthetase subunit TsaC/SUA5/YrdC